MPLFKSIGNFCKRFTLDIYYDIFSQNGVIMKLYNSETRQIEDFIPYNANTVTLYTCGPTVYHFAHIGNLRSYIMEDVLEKSLRYLGYNVKRAMNITDVGHLSGDSDDGEDKMLLGAEREHKTVMEIAKEYTNAFKEDCNKLNIKWPEIVVPATSCIDQYIDIISKLLENGFAYQSNGNIYFDTSKLKNYYRFGMQNADNMVIGARDSVEEDSGKRNQNDFVLWFTKSKFSNHALKWNSPWGVGYPGWHIECSGISYKYLGENLDIHCGGVDNKFPHHTNEIAQTESYIGHKWCNYWFHVEHLITSAGKMSKSSGEFLTVSLLQQKGYNPLDYRFFCLQSHYRKQLLFSYEILDNAKNAYRKLLLRISKLNPDGEINNIKFKEYKDKFSDCLANDLNTALALTTVYDVLKDEEINDATKLAIISDFDKVLSLDLCKTEEKKSVLSDEEIKEFILKRKEAKVQKNFALADQIRNDLLKKGVKLIDTREGTSYELI